MEEMKFSQLEPGIGLAGGKYVIEKKIGEGGFGITYRAIQTGLNRAVCIKEYFLAGRCVRDVQARTIHVQGAGEDLFEKYRAAFVKEAQTLAALHHQGIVEVIDIFDENNTSYMVMPFIEGRSLQSIVEKNGPLSYPEAVNYIAQVANAVGYVHEHHILHRDIKPDNIMITADNKAVLIDFGSAREFEEDKMQSQTSMVTHGYAPTEQYTRSSRKGAYTDIYAIGATLYFVLTGRVPIEAAARITEAMPEPRELNPKLPEEANRTIMKAMQIKPQDRHQSIAEFMDDLLNTAPSTPTPAAPKPSPKEKPAAEPEAKPVAAAPVKNEPPVENTPKKKSNKALGAIIAIAAVVILGLVLYFVFAGSSKQDEAAAHVDEYKCAVKDCKRIATMWGENTDSLLKAKDLMENTVRVLEEKYAKEMPDTYNQLETVADAIFPKLKAVAKEYADEAKMRIRNGDDPETIISEFEYSLSIFNDPNVRNELNEYKASKGITDAPTSTNTQTSQNLGEGNNGSNFSDAGNQGMSNSSVQIAEVIEEDEVIEEVYSVVDVNPEFPGGEDALYRYLSANLRYPQIAKDNGITGKVYVSFVVESDGRITNPKILRDIGGGVAQKQFVSSVLCLDGLRANNEARLYVWSTTCQSVLI